MSVIQRIKELREKATPGDWTNIGILPKSFEDHGWRSIAGSDRLMVPKEQAFGQPDGRYDREADFIVSLYNALPQLIQEHEALLRFVKEVLAMDKTIWSTYVDEDPDEQWNKCNAEWRGDIKRLAKIHGLDKELKG